MGFKNFEKLLDRLKMMADDPSGNSTPSATGNRNIMAGTVQTSDPLVAVIMGSKSDWETMRHAEEILTQFSIPHECRVVSAHRTPDLMLEFAKSAETRGIEVIIAGAGGAAHLPGMTAANTILPVLGVPIE